MMKPEERIGLLLKADKAVLKTIDAILTGRESSASPPPSLDDCRLFTIKEAAARLQFSRNTIYKLIGSGELKAVKVGSHKRISMAALRGFQVA